MIEIKKIEFVKINRWTYECNISDEFTIQIRNLRDGRYQAYLLNISDNWSKKFYTLIAEEDSFSKIKKEIQIIFEKIFSSLIEIKEK